MTKITYSPATELIIHEVLEVSREDLLRTRITPQGNMPLLWCDGVLFTWNPFPTNDKVVDDLISGKIHWASVNYTHMERYSPVLKLNEEEYKGEMNIRVLDVGAIPTYKDVVKWLKSNAKK